MYQQKKDQIKSNKTNQVKMWQNLEKALVLRPTKKKTNTYIVTQMKSTVLILAKVIIKNSKELV